MTVNLKSSNFSPFYYPFIAPASISVYGPSGYYRTAWCPGSTFSYLPKTMAYTFTNAPLGAYRIRVAWSGRAEANQYPTLAWWYPWLTASFNSPR